MKKFLFSLMLVTPFTCNSISDGIKRCENDEVICYVYDTGWAGRGSGISCKFKEQSDEQYIEISFNRPLV